MLYYLQYGGDRIPQFDKRRTYEVPIEFNAVEDLSGLPCIKRITLLLITDGKVVISFNGEARTLISPCVLCISEHDRIEVIENKRLYAQSFHLHPSFLKSRSTYSVLHLFYQRDTKFNGVLNLPPDAYIKIFEWMAVIGTEIAAQSDSRWTCRVRAYFLRILSLLDEICKSRNIDDIIGKPCSNVDIILEYLHTHYMDEITLEALCRRAHTNRTTLNRDFKERTGDTVIAYLLNYRLRVASELLAHTSLTIDEIARTSGFVYGTYLIRQFKSKSGQTPTEYRRITRKKHNIIVHKNY